MFLFRTSLIAAAIASAMAAPALAAGEVSIRKSRDANVKVWNTIFGFRVGDPKADIDLPAGDRLKANRSWWATDTSTQQRFLGVAAVERTAEHALAAIIPDPENPGQVTMPRLNSWLFDQFGMQQFELADMASEDSDLYVAVDLSAWIAGGGVRPPDGSVLNIVNGTHPMLPGYLLSPMPAHFDPNVGWDSPARYNGPAFVLGDIITNAPEPATLALIGLGGLAALRRRRR